MSYLRAGFVAPPRPTTSKFEFISFLKKIFVYPAPFLIIYFAPPHFCPPKIAPAGGGHFCRAKMARPTAEGAFFSPKAQKWPMG